MTPLACEVLGKIGLIHQIDNRLSCTYENMLVAGLLIDRQKLPLIHVYDILETTN